MDRECARCRASAHTVLRAPFEWEWYLWQWWGVDIPVAGIGIPLCRGCLPRAAALQEAMFTFEVYAPAERRSIWTDVCDFLDDLALDALVTVESGERSSPTPEHVRPL